MSEDPKKSNAKPEEKSGKKKSAAKPTGAAKKKVKKAEPKKSAAAKTPAKKKAKKKPAKRPLFRIVNYGPIKVTDYGRMLLYDIKCIDADGQIVEERTLDKGSKIFDMIFKDIVEDENGNKSPFWRQNENGQWVDPRGLSWYVIPRG